MGRVCWASGVPSIHSVECRVSKVGSDGAAFVICYCGCQRPWQDMLQVHSWMQEHVIVKVWTKITISVHTFSNMYDPQLPTKVLSCLCAPSFCPSAISSLLLACCTKPLRRSSGLGSELVARLSRLVFSAHRPTVAALMTLGLDLSAAAAAVTATPQAPPPAAQDAGQAVPQGKLVRFCRP